ncbi:MAG: cytochrome c [Acidimicrobiia bacterium]|nr:cytochrome c [Acidimicrobiia bacterium]
MGEGADVPRLRFPPRAHASRRSTGTAGAGGVGFIGAGPDDAHIVDVEAANRGKSLYAAECITCHGPKGRGGDQGADLVRSLVVLEDRYGATIGDFPQARPPDSKRQAQRRDHLFDTDDKPEGWGGNDTLYGFVMNTKP